MKDGLLAQLNAAYEFFKRSTGNLTEEDSAFAPAAGVFTAAGQVAHAAPRPSIGSWTERSTRKASTWTSPRTPNKHVPSPH